MITLYHGSFNLFERPSNSKVQEGFTSSEYGVGFNTSDYGGDAWEHANGIAGGPGVIYSYEFDETRLEKWLVGDRPIGQDIYDNIIANLDSLPNIANEERIREELTPDTNGFEAFGLLQGRHKQGTEFLQKCGVEGSYTGNYFIFFDANKVPEQKIHQVLGDFPAAHTAFEEQKKSGKLSVDQPVKYDGTIVGPRKDYKSEELSFAAWDIHATGDADLITSFEDMVNPLLTDPDITKPGGNGFSLRNNLGSAISRSLRDGGQDLTDHWSGANTFQRTFDWAETTPEGDKIVPLARAVRDRILSRDSVPA